METYLFDVKMVAAIGVQAANADEAKAKIMMIDGYDANLGSWPNGDPILCEISAHEAELAGE